RSACVRKTQRPDLEEEDCSSSQIQGKKVPKSSAVVAPDRTRAPRGQSPVKRGLVIDPLMIGVPKRPSHRDRSHQNSAWHQKPRQLTCEAAIVRDMLQHLVAVHDIK